MEQVELKAYAAMAPVEESMLEPNSSYAQILSLIDGPKRVVDFGCGPGNLSRLLARRGCTIIGVDINPEHAVMAREYCEDVLVQDLDCVNLADLFPAQRFDVAIFADILEHLRTPERLMAQVGAILQPGGCVIASIPNVAHAAVRLALLNGDFDYKAIGVLDDSHLRFFTRKSMESFFDKAGLIVDEVSRTIAPIFEPTGTLVPAVDPQSVPEAVLQKLRNDPDAETLQFIVRAVPAEFNARVASKQRLARLERRAQDLEQKLRAAEMQLAEKLDAPSREHLDGILERLHIATLERDAARTAQQAAEGARLEAVAHADASLVENARLSRREAQLVSEIQQLASALEIAGAERSKLETLLANATEGLAFERQRGEQRDKQVAHLQAILQHQVEQVNSFTAERDAIATQLDEALHAVSSLQERLDNAVRDGMEVRRNAEAEAHVLRAQVREAQLRAEQAEFYLEAMRQSKFWQIRNVWFKVKGVFGVTSDIP